MKTATATYRAPAGDNKVVEMGGVTFFDGQTVDLNTDDHEHMISKLQNNPHFDIQVSENDVTSDEPTKRGPGRTKKVDTSAAQAEANDHDFEKDRRDALNRNPAGGNDEVKS
jgi:hypothetical protein